MIEINNLTTNPINEESLKKIAQKVLDGEKRINADLSVALVGPARIKQLNKKYRGKNRVTDVLAFPESKMILEKFHTRVSPDREILGEVVICLREVKKNTKRFGATFEKELATVLIHGVLHLLGYEHEKSEEKARLMEEKEQYYLSEVF